MSFILFNGFDLGLKDKFNNTLSVGDNIKDIFFDEDTGQFKSNVGEIVYDTERCCFSVQWEDDITPILEYEPDFWKGVEKC